MIWRREDEIELVLVKLVRNCHWHGSAKHMEIDFTGFAMVREAVALLLTGMAVKEAFWVGGG